MTIEEKGKRIVQDIKKEKTECLSQIYDEIYNDGALLYEIEEFVENGNCRIRYCR